ncbi:hypothetical protein JW977_03945 [Candidatus Falkowbacteria bacterium]|nr:hypothetical protein [Candidatus Falkowbacteria bacterium]
MLKLIAVQYKSGLAILFLNKTFHLYKPPYGLQIFTVLTAEEVVRAISDNGLIAQDIEFDNFGEFIQFMCNKSLIET